MRRRGLLLAFVNGPLNVVSAPWSSS